MELFPTGTPVTRAGLNNIPRATLNMIRPGPGIRMFPTGDGGVCISANEIKERNGGVGGGGAKTRTGKFASLNTDGDTMEVYLWAGSDWEEETSSIYKPYVFQKSRFDDGLTHTYADGETREYNTVGLDGKYQRRASWAGGTVTEVQEIAQAYEVGEELQINTTYDGYYIDANNAGRHWASVVEIPE